MTVRPQLHRARVRLHRAHFALDERVVAIHDLHAVEREFDDVALFQIDELVGRAGQRQRVGRQEVLSLAHAHHQRRPGTRAHHTVRLLLAEHGNGVSAVQTTRRQTHGLIQVARRAVRQNVMDQMRDDFGVGLRHELVAKTTQLVTQAFVVLDDAVVHQRHFVARENGVRVVRDRRAMGRPTGMGNARLARQLRLRKLLVEIRHTRHATRTLRHTVLQHRHAARVVTAILQTAQPFDQHRYYITSRYRADNAAHIRFLPCQKFRLIRPVEIRFETPARANSRRRHIDVDFTASACADGRSPSSLPASCR